MLEPPCHSPGDQRLVEGSLFCATGDLGAAATDTPLPVPSSRRVRAKVVPLRGLSLELLVREVPRMPDVIIDVQAPIDSLRLIKSDLEAYFWEYPADAESRRVERFEISFWVRQLADRTAALESILMHKGTAQVVVRGLSVAEAEDLQAAVAVLDQWIREDEPFCDVARKVAAILSATDRIGLRAAGGVARPASP